MPLDRKEAEKLIDVIQSLVAPLPGKTPANLVIEKKGEPPVADKTPAAGAEFVDAIPFAEADKESLYQQFKVRLLTECPIDPVLLHILTTRPEVSISVERREVRLDDGSLRGRIAILIADGKINPIVLAAKDIKKELMKTGPEPAGNRFSEALTSLVNDGILMREGDGYITVPGLKITKQTVTT